mmetsp:Transcript_31246/g.72267  ORF Transcript_31246/g.72267 Transcript_31246/m.72267 type:complete len:251 (+) Transcript_31246:1146-1898(+)
MVNSTGSAMISSSPAAARFSSSKAFCCVCQATNMQLSIIPAPLVLSNTGDSVKRCAQLCLSMTFCRFSCAMKLDLRRFELDLVWRNISDSHVCMFGVVGVVDRLRSGISTGSGKSTKSGTPGIAFVDEAFSSCISSSPLRSNSFDVTGGPSASFTSASSEFLPFWMVGSVGGKKSGGLGDPSSAASSCFAGLTGAAAGLMVARLAEVFRKTSCSGLEWDGSWFCAPGIRGGRQFGLGGDGSAGSGRTGSC